VNCFKPYALFLFELLELNKIILVVEVMSANETAFSKLVQARICPKKSVLWFPYFLQISHLERSILNRICIRACKRGCLRPFSLYKGLSVKVTTSAGSTVTVWDWRRNGRRKNV